MPQAKPSWISQPFLGLWLDLPQWQGDPRSFQACNNVRITNGTVTSELMGWTFTNVTLNGPVTLIAQFPTNNSNFMVLGTPTDLYDWHNGTPVYITPVYTTGNATCDGTTPVITGGNGTLWATKMGALGVRTNAMPGDEISFGNVNINDPNATWYTIASVDSDTQITLTTNGPDIFNLTYTLRQKAQGDTDQFRWQFEVYPEAGPPLNGDAIFMTNGLDPVVTWTGAGFASYQADMPFVCRFMRRFKNMMIYGALTQDGATLYTSIANSDNGLPLELAEGIANQFVVSDGPYNMNHLGVLGNNLMVYMGTMDAGSVVAAQFVGFPTLFVFTEVIRGRGPVGTGLVVEFPDRHEFIAYDGQYRYNGLYTQLMNQHVWRVVLQNFDRSRAFKCFSHLVPQYGLAHIVIPLLTDAGDDLETAYIENYLEQPQQILFKPITQRDFPFTAAGQLPASVIQEYWNLDTDTWDIDPHRWNNDTATGSYPNLYVGDVDGKIYTLFTAETQSESFVLFSQRMLANERQRALVRRVYPFVNYVAAGYNISVTVNLYDQVGGAQQISDTQTMAMNYSGNRFTSHFRRGRLAEVRFSTAGPNQPWTLDGYDWDLSPGGLR